ncbi:hypothetical protein DQ237_13225 [Blastococcus sp. TF02-8]|uniref:hypothetical protein n=1 Tax=Blastococcus sp. TF02-8 TaxID=2250574 RepID=UPI000DEA38EB|nr:hypothetical protein [Blastococcus sp. TF02-8]RBY95497.1 hypothetical protein DQ237_13225 [Blastococcus sp. TF02-8]
MTVIPLPRHGHWVGDLRGEGRSVRVTAHVDRGLVNLSLWRDDTCVGSARLLPADAAALVAGLSDGLAVIAAEPTPATSGEERLRHLEERLAGLESRLTVPPRREAGPRVRAVARSVRTTAGRWLRDYR